MRRQHDPIEVKALRMHSVRELPVPRVSLSAEFRPAEGRLMVVCGSHSCVHNWGCLDGEKSRRDFPVSVSKGVLILSDWFEVLPARNGIARIVERQRVMGKVIVTNERLEGIDIFDHRLSLLEDLRSRISLVTEALRLKAKSGVAR